jgi:hypothetical protein
MTQTVFSGPLAGLGPMLGTTGTPSPSDGPAIDYQGKAVADPRFAANKDATGSGAVKGFYHTAGIAVVDAIPSANASNTVAAAQAPSTTAGVAIGLISAQAGTAAGVPVFAPGIPIIPLNGSAVVTVAAIDFGFATGTTVANSTTVTVDDNSKFTLGQWLVIAGAGGAQNKALFTQVQTISTNTTIITILPAALTAGNNLPIGQGNLYSPTPPSTQFGPQSSVPVATEPYKAAGFVLAFDALQGVARALSVTAASIGSGTTAITVAGYDIWGVPMTELLTANGTTTVNGKKAFKYVSGITVTTAATTVTPASISVGVSDVFGLPLRSDKWEYLNISWNGCTAPTSAGWTAALATTSNATTIDVRGVVNASTLAVTNAASTNGARRLTIIQHVPLNNMINASPIATSSLFGVPQA